MGVYDAWNQLRSTLIIQQVQHITWVSGAQEDKGTKDFVRHAFVLKYFYAQF